MKDSLHEADRWLRQAENDLAFGRVALREGFFHQACFIAQQAGEKALKAVLYALGERIVLGHSLVELVGKLSEHFPDAAARREAAGVLDQYYVPTRYPNGLPGGVPFEAFGESQARAAVDEAERFLSFAQERIATRRKAGRADSEGEPPDEGGGEPERSLGQE